MKLFTIAILTMILTAMTISGQTMPPPEAGVSQTLAKWRAANYSNVRYKLNITLEKGAPLMRGDVEISVSLTDEGAKNDLVLDWRTTQFQNDSQPPTASIMRINNWSPPGGPSAILQPASEHLIIPKEFLKAGENTVRIYFASPIKTSGAAVTRYVDKEDGAEYIYSLFVPSEASTAFPIFDQPDLKARFTLHLVVPEKWKAVSNEEIVKSGITTLDDKPFPPGQTKSRLGTLYIFPETKPISTYVFAFAAGEFAEFKNCDYPVSDNSPNLKNFQPKMPLKPYLEKENRKKLDISECKKAEILKDLNKDVALTSAIYVRKSQVEKFKLHAAEVFRLNREGVKFLETYFDYKFPFPKYDLVLIPEFPFGGMEHAGATFLRESSIIFPTEPTKNDFVSRANLIFHEAAHQWFGDTVTMRWFDDLWLKEGFAEFMAYKTLEKVMPEYNAWKIFYERNKQAAYLTDSTKGTTPIYQEIPNLSAAKSAYGNIVYRKAPSFLRQAEFLFGEDKFQIAVRAFLKKHQFANAEWTDLVKEFQSVTGYGLTYWGNDWVKKRGVPIIRINNNTISQENSIGEEAGWSQKFQIYTFEKNTNPEYKNVILIEPFLLDKFSQSFNSSPKATFIFPNYQDYGYGIFLLDEKSRTYVLANIQTEKDDFLRAMMWGALWDSVREGELNPKDYVELVIKNIRIETDESTIQTLLNRVSTAMNYYLSDAQRVELAPRIEKILVGRIFTANTTGQKITFFRAYLSLASSAYSRRLLKKILRSNGKPVELETLGSVIGKVPALELPPLKTKDKFDIVTKLLILEDKKSLGKSESEELLADLEKTETSDEAKRYAYAAKAAIATKENKAKFWNDFINNKEISESWIESAVVAFNSPRHSALTLPYLEKSLAELPNLKKNRKIFFVNGWLAAFIGGQRSEEALNIVNKFLADNPKLDKDLRLKILENADNLERAVKIRAKYGN